MSIKALSDYTINAKYARYLKDKKRRETWEEQVERTFAMHERRYSHLYEKHPELKDEIDFAKRQVLKKRTLGSQRNLQFAGPQLEKHHAKGYNCSFSHCDRLQFFQECMYLLLCGCGVGVSVQKHHIEQLPEFDDYWARTDLESTEKCDFVVEDSIEGWSDAIGAVIKSYYEGNEFSRKNLQFDYSKIRPEGALISGGFKAPGPKGLEAAIEKINLVFRKSLLNGQEKLRPIDAFDIIMHSADAVLSGGVRRSAVITLFSHDDEEMMNAKVGDWFITNPQRGRSNNSAVLLKGGIKKEDFHKLIKSTKEFGEPGFVWVDDLEFGVNPCVEIGLYPKTEDGRSGFQFCNLCEINGKWCKSEEDFLKACRAAAIIGTLQAGYTDFKYVSKETKEITEREALLGCSITGVMDNPEIILNPEIQRKGAEEIKKKNKEIAAIIGINPAARTTCIKPAGTTSCVLGTASGIHPHHAKRYIRRVQANKMEFPAQHFKEVNPLAVENSFWSNNNTDVVISFCCEVPQGAVVKNQISAIELLERVKLTQQNWVRYGTEESLCVKKGIRHNVSNTITVKDDEWQEVADYIFENQKWFAGISLLPFSGDKDYVQTPFTTIHEPKELLKIYGNASIVASGLIVDGLHAFNNNLWRACDTVLGIGEDLSENIQEPQYPTKRNNKQLAEYFLEKERYEELFLKKDWVRRVKKFASKHYDFNEQKYNEYEAELKRLNGDLLLFKKMQKETKNEKEKESYKGAIFLTLKKISDINMNEGYTHEKSLLKKTTYCLKDVSNWKLWDDLTKSYKEIDWSSVVEEKEFLEDVSKMGAQACAGGKCEL